MGLLFVPYHVSHPTSIADALENLLLNIFRYDRVKLDRISAVNGKLGAQQWLCEQYGLGVTDIYNAAKAMIEEK